MASPTVGLVFHVSELQLWGLVLSVQLRCPSIREIGERCISGNNLCHVRPCESAYSCPCRPQSGRSSSGILSRRIRFPLLVNWKPLIVCMPCEAHPGGHSTGQGKNDPFNAAYKLAWQEPVDGKTVYAKLRPNQKYPGIEPYMDISNFETDVLTQ